MLIQGHVDCCCTVSAPRDLGLGIAARGRVSKHRATDQRHSRKGALFAETNNCVADGHAACNFWWLDRSVRITGTGTANAHVSEPRFQNRAGGARQHAASPVAG
ncbi:hypothetical protein B0G69_6480 [Paraburkholderia sp. RAU2J]|nr:hypothetical protein B0G69_6480 [Paraburkholderia sp. RAU2J]